MIVNIDAMRRKARQRLPKTIFEFIDGGAEDERTLAENRNAFSRLAFRPRALTDVGTRSQATTLLGQPLAIPLVLAPTGLIGLVAPHGERAAIRAARKHGALFCLSTASTCTIEEAAAETAASLWFQLYIWRDRSLTAMLVERARAAGYGALCLTIDVPVIGHRERDTRNAFTTNPRITRGNLFDMLTHLGWVRRMMTTPFITFANFAGTAGAPGKNPVALGSFVNSQMDPTATWADIEWLRALWKGPLVVKGIMSGEDAKKAVECGATGVVVSNHGGRQLDGLPAAIDVLPEVVEAVGDRAEVILDGGVRRGSDVVKAVALGARACMIGRPFVYGLAVAGEEGVARVLTILETEIDRALALLGCPGIGSLDRTYLRLPAGASSRWR